MDYGFVRVGAAIPKVKVADCDFNKEEIYKLILDAEDKGIQIITFPELCLTGYSCGDLFFQKLLLDKAQEALSFLLEKTKKVDALCVLGLPYMVGTRLMNLAVAIQKGKILLAVPKTWLPNYGEFYEKRWFASATEIKNVTELTMCNQVVPFGTNVLIHNKAKNVCVGIEICEDIWMPIPPSSYKALNGANIILNLSASDDVVAKNDYRENLVSQQSARCMSAYIYCSAGFGESSTDVVYGGNGIISEKGNILNRAERFSLNSQIVFSDVDIEMLNGERLKNTGFMPQYDFECNCCRFVDFKLDDIKKESIREIDSKPFVPSGKELYERCNEIFSIQVQGLVQRLNHIGCKRAVVGISGGLDSTLALLVTCQAFDKLNISRKNILGVTMPGFGTTDRTYNNAVSMIKSLGVEFREISISKSVRQHFIDIDHDESDHSVTYENAQARERTQILMDLSNKINGIVIGTGDLSELALGWATYNGDQMSMYGVNSGVPKTLVRSLVKWVADNKSDDITKKVLLDVIDTPVSPELLPATKDGNISQKTEDLVGPYELHDFFLYNMLRFGFDPKKIEWMANKAFDGEFDSDLIHYWLKVFYKRFFTQQFKRSCMPDGPKVGSVSLSPRGDWRMPSDASVKLWLGELE